MRLLLQPGCLLSCRAWIAGLMTGMLVLGFTTGARAFTVVERGQPHAVVILPEDPRAVVQYAADELVAHVQKATGVRLVVEREGAALSQGPRIYLGDTRRARAVGVEAGGIRSETFIFKNVTDGLVIAGGDGDGDPLSTSVPAGTLFGVYEWLEQTLQVRWLWPGPLGTFVPTRSTVISEVVDGETSPRFVQRQVRGGLTFKSEYPALGFTPEALADYSRQQAIFLRRHRMGRSEPVVYGHAFTDWWQRYGAQHPEWFQLVNGRRGPVKPGASYSMCVSNPEFQHEIVRQWQERRKALPSSAAKYLNLVENGTMGLCECERCRAWDGPPPADYMDFYPAHHKMRGSHCVTDRYARFWLAVQAEAEKIDPEVTLIVYNYFNYYYPPSENIKLNDRIWVGSYPSSGWYPRSAEENEWFQRQWRGWQRTGARLFSRGNYCLDGYSMPYVFAHQFAEEFKFQVAHGLMATDYDALTGQWGTQLPNLYLLMRLHVRPDAEADQLLDELYTTFGAAGPAVKAYFDYWENYLIARRAETNQIFEQYDASRWRSWAKVADKVFPPECFAAADALLERAAAAVAGEREASARVEFLRAGLQHAKLCVNAAALLTLADPQSNVSRGQQALDELMAFRRAHERDPLANFNHSAWIEDRSWVLPESARRLD